MIEGRCHFFLIFNFFFVGVGREKGGGGPGFFFAVKRTEYVIRVLPWDGSGGGGGKRGTMLW